MKKSFLEISRHAKAMMLAATGGTMVLAAVMHFGGGVGEPGVSLGLALCSIAILGVLRSALAADGSSARWVVSVMLLIGILDVLVDAAFMLAGGMPSGGPLLQAARWGANFRANSLIVNATLTLALSVLLMRDYRGRLRWTGIMLLAAPIVGWGSALLTHTPRLVGTGLNDASQRMLWRMAAMAISFLCHIAPIVVLNHALPTHKTKD